MELQIRDVSKTYPNGVQALKGVTLTTPLGCPACSALAATASPRSGASMATLLEPDQGSIRLGAPDVIHQKDDVRKTLGCLPQGFGVYAEVSAGDLLERFADRA